MRFLARPNVDDVERLRAVCNSRKRAAPTIRLLRERVEDRYAHYLAGAGDPWVVAEDEEFAAPKDSFHDVYKHPPKSLGFIAAIRDQTFGSCPVCGSGSTGSLDHYLPKATYAEFSFFSSNLVPSCHRCNGKKGSACRGEAEGERAIHPYFDVAAGSRLIIALFEPPVEAPLFRAIPHNVPPQLAAAVTWHIENIVMRAGFAGHCQQRWSRLVREPRLFLGGDAADDAVREQLRINAERAAALSQSENSWDCCFFSGVAEADVAVNYLAKKLGEQELPVI